MGLVQASVGLMVCAGLCTDLAPVALQIYVCTSDFLGAQ